MRLAAWYESMSRDGVTLAPGEYQGYRFAGYVMGQAEQAEMAGRAAEYREKARVYAMSMENEPETGREAADYADNAQAAREMLKDRAQAPRYHAFIDKSARKPFVCGICGRDIKHPYHQPVLTGFGANTSTVEAEPEEVFKPTREESQMRLF